MDETSVQLVSRCRSGDESASRELYDRYVSRLITLVHRRMSGQLKRRVDAEDVIQSTFRSFFSGLNTDKFQFDESGDMWRLLVVIALNKLRRRAAYHNAAKRGMANEQSVNHAASDEHRMRCFEAAAMEPLPDAAAAVLDEFEVLTAGLEPLQVEILKLRMYGYEMTEIAKEVGRSERTVRRLLEKVRAVWQERLEAVAI